MIHRIPCAPAGASSWSQVTALDGTEYLLTFVWAQRLGAWLLSIADGAGVAIASGLVLTTGRSLLVGVVDPRTPPGAVVVVDQTGAGDADPGFTDLGARFSVVYLDVAELAA